MPDLTARLIAILRKYMRDPNAAVSGTTTLDELDIDNLDLPMICLDVEEAYDVTIGYGDDLDGLATVGDVAARLAERLAAKAVPRLRAPRRRSSWISTSA
jgi:acyl carrier protein